MSEKIKKNERNEMWKMSKVFIIITITIPALLILSTVYFYSAGYFSSQMSEKKPVIYLPTKWVGNLTYLYFGEEEVTYDNLTPLAKYWYREYLKTHTWNVSCDGIIITIHPDYITGDWGSEMMELKIVLKSTTYIGQVKYISNGTEMAIKNEGCVWVKMEEINYRYKIRNTREISLPGDPSVADIHTIDFKMSNISFVCANNVDIDPRNTNATLPYNFTAYVETKDKIYRFDFRFNLINKHYPFIDLDYLSELVNATYYCFIPSEDKVVISNHLVNGTKFFFVEMDGRLSKIAEVSNEVSE